MAAAAAIMAIKARKDELSKLAHNENDEMHLSSAQRSRLMDEFRKQNLAFVANLYEGKGVGSSPHDEASIDGHSQRTPDEENYSDIEQWPIAQPSYLSSRHHQHLMTKPYNARWWNAYWRSRDPECNRSKTRFTPSTSSRVTPESFDTHSETHLESGTIMEEERTSLEVFEKDDESIALRGSGEKNLDSFSFLYSRAMQGTNELFYINQLLVSNDHFNALIVGCIIIAGILVGIQSYPSMDRNIFLTGLDMSVQILFTFECIVKIFAEGVHPIKYWLGPDKFWNNFDFWLVLICWLPMGGNVAFLRLLRLMRLLKLVGKVKQLQVIVMGLLKGLSSVSYIMVLMLLIFYLFAVLGVGSFRKNDPFHFGSIGIAMLTLFRCSTLEDWSDVMYINMYGCASQFSAVDGVYYGKDGGPVNGPDGEHGSDESGMGTPFGYLPLNLCWSSQPQPLLSTVYFIFFVLIAAFVMLSLFVGAVCGGMSEAMETFKEQERNDREERLKLAAAAAAAAEENDENENDRDNGQYSLEALKIAFEACDEDGGGDIDAEELANAMAKMGVAGVSVETAQEMIASVDADGGGTMGFDEFVNMMTSGKSIDDMDQQGNQHRKSLIEEGTIDQVEGDECKQKSLSSEAERIAAAAKAEEQKDKAASLMLVNRIRRAWEGRRERYHFALMEDGYWKSYLQLSCRAETVTVNPNFNNVITMTIVAAGVVVGIQTEITEPSGGQPKTPILDALDTIILAIFTIEIVVKMIAQGHEPMRYFDDSWNKFDFFIVAACFIFMLPFMPDVGPMLAMLRLLRLLRVLKLVKALPQLRIIIEALISGFGSISFVTIILFMFFYLFANIGMIFFGENDPMHFGNLQSALMSLFRASTLDDWTDIMYINMYGCDHWEYGYGRFNGKISRDKKAHANCNDPYAWGWLAAFFMVSFVILGALVLLTLFIGIVATAMEEAKHQQRLDAKNEIKLLERVSSLGISLPVQLDLYRDIFDDLDKGKDGVLNKGDMKPFLRALPLLHVASNAGSLFSRAEANIDKGAGINEKVLKEMDALAALDSGNVVITRSDIDKLCSAINNDYHGNVDFNDFLVIMEFLRRSGDAPQALMALRNSYATAVDNSIQPSHQREENPSIESPSDEPTLSIASITSHTDRKHSSRTVIDINMDVEEIDLENIEQIFNETKTEQNAKKLANEMAELQKCVEEARDAIYRQALNSASCIVQANDEEKQYQARILGMKEELSALRSALSRVK